MQGANCMSGAGSVFSSRPLQHASQPSPGVAGIQTNNPMITRLPALPTELLLPQTSQSKCP